MLIATTNKAKLAEYKKYFSLFLPQIKLLSLSDLRINELPAENGKTFEENALIKARFYAKKTSLLTLADDGGLEIRALNNQPGVLSRRWPGYEATDKELVNMVIEKLKRVPIGKRQAQLRVAIAVVDSKGQIVAKEEEKIKGIIPEKPSSWIEEKFPFRAVLYLPQFKKYYQDLNEKEHNLVNHRKKAIVKLAKKLKNYFK